MHGFVSAVGGFFVAVFMFVLTFLLAPLGRALKFGAAAALGAIGLFVYCLLTGDGPLTLLEGVRQEEFDRGFKAGRAETVKRAHDLVDIVQNARDGGQATINKVGELATEPNGQLSS